MKYYMRWAQDGLKSCHIVLNVREDLLGPIFGIMQRGVIASLKGYLVFKKKDILEVHDTMVLLDMCIKIEPNFEKFKSKIALIHEYAEGSRYPNDDFVMPDATTARLLLNDAQELFEFVQDKLNA